MFELNKYELDYLDQLDNFIQNEKEFVNLEKLLYKKYEFLKQLHLQEIEYIKSMIEMRRVDDKYDIDRRSLAK